LPDLFLYRVARSGRVERGHFVEVKRPRERVSQAQKEEIAFLQELGLSADVVRIREIASRR
jgi:hypothetical protein